MQSWQSPLGWKRQGLAVQARQERERRRGEVVGTCEEVEGRWSEGRESLSLRGSVGSRRCTLFPLREEVRFAAPP